MNYSNRELLTRLYKRVVHGKVQNKITLFDLKNDGYEALESPVFVLSTGRCRTHWLTTVLARNKNVMVYHNPEISFLEEGKLLYEYFTKDGNLEKVIEQLVFTARDNLWLDCAKRELRYIETNNRITFALPILKTELKESKFVHLTRHPIGFIKSGRNRGWYEGNSHDLGRIVLSNITLWDTLSLIQKIGWLWLETNRFILTHSFGLPSHRYWFAQSEQLSEDKMLEFMKFLDIEESSLRNKWFKKATNIQSDVLQISEAEIKNELKKAFYYKEFKELSARLGYTL